MTPANPKPLFIPLAGQWFDKFASGEKTAEYRLYGGRWNHASCWYGRPVILSRGHGKQSRLNGVITRFQVLNGAALGMAEQKAIESIYGPGNKEIAVISIEVQR
jgi:hypothetical protein